MSSFRGVVLTFARRNSHVPELKFILDDEEGVDISWIGEAGLVNIVLLIESRDKKDSIVIKYGESAAPRSEGLKNCNWSLDRIDVEYNMIDMVNEIAPGTVAKPFCFDKEMSMIAMENLSHMELLGPILQEAPRPDLALRIGEAIGRIEYISHVRNVSPETWQYYEGRLASFSEYIVAFKGVRYRKRFSLDRMEDSTIPPENMAFFLEATADLEANGRIDRLWEVTSRHDCLTPDDCHMYSIFTSDDRVALIDFETGGLGNQCFPVSYLSACFVLCMMAVQGKQDSDEARTLTETQARQAIENLIAGFFSAFEGHPSVIGDLGNFFSEMTIVMGWTLFVLTNIRGIEAFFVIPLPQRLLAMKKGFELMMHSDEITSLNDVLDRIFK